MEQHSFDAILQAVPMPMLFIDADERILNANLGGEAVLGAGQIGRHHAIALRQPALLTTIEAALRDGVAGQARYVILGPSYEVTYLVSVTPVSSDGHSGVLCAFKDITEEELVSRFRRDFVANVSHELRTPLTSLVGFIETLKGAAKDDPAARDRFLTIMEHQAGRMNRLVRDLLSLSKVEAEERQRPTTYVSIDDLIAAVVATLRPVADAAGVVVKVNGGSTAPHVPADGDQLAQVFQNLIENAIKYGGPSKTVTVSIHPASDDPMLRIDVLDEGDGIAPQHLPRLTERFYRIDTHRSREQGGTGLGLAIVKHIINRHRGRMAISSERGEGSCFTVFLPKA